MCKSFYLDSNTQTHFFGRTSILVDYIIHFLCTGSLFISSPKNLIQLTTVKYSSSPENETHCNRLSTEPHIRVDDTRYIDGLTFFYRFLTPTSAYCLSCCISRRFVYFEVPLSRKTIGGIFVMELSCSSIVQANYFKRHYS